jgi:hypothetical protein
MAQVPPPTYPTLSQRAYEALFPANRQGQPANPLTGQYQTVVDVPTEGKRQGYRWKLQL